MFLYDKKIVYLSRYQGEKRGSGAGFVRVTGKSNEWCIDIQVKREFCRPGNEYILYFLIGNEKILVENFSVQAAGIVYHRGFQVNREKIFLQGREYNEKDFLGIEIKDGSEAYIAGYLKEPLEVNEGNKLGNVKEKEILDMDQKDKSIQETEDVKSEEQKKSEPEIVIEQAKVFATNLEEKPQEIRTFDNKWEQLLNDYPQLHPFGDERVFISIEPKDFIVLRASYQKLVNNSFLLHGFYNYRYLILGLDREIREDDKECFYLGVPGTYFEREKMVAVMFGFEGFECAGPVEIGKFGFYMRKVEL